MEYLDGTTLQNILTELYVLYGAFNKSPPNGII